MIRYSYNQQIQPPAPFVHVTIRCPETGSSVSDVPAQLDCAADRSVIPGPIVAALGLVPLDEIQVGGFGGQVFVVPTFRVEMGIRGLQGILAEVIAHDDEPVVLLGRDVLNRHNINLLGPTQKLENDV
jgi:hypothetical protein